MQYRWVDNCKDNADDRQIEFDDDRIWEWWGRDGERNLF